ncbi:pleckstrin homology domain-containing family M member 2 [Aplysia californica]|uniref:Pleckstrin homology domain-containing family M member 2 n=1 Tax=Aplysia californica TaxID=6500 RepID=A0ABM0K156_APLCA|nr:pleckstrin homology domain-containing family M member 2 [Aplysia californica]XP_005106324.1 pleckstrin homology domain-containing family M member 2 [Aplysia californica]
MARPADRMRLKDRIIDNISKAIKGIQELLYYQSKDPVVAGSQTENNVLTLGNGDRACHKLCENLDHALLHGLKNVTHGYWRMVKQLSHKGMVKEIEYLTNVTTDLGKGRAWLYASLNEGLLESYVRLLGENEKLVKKFYAKDALMLDGDRMNVMLTLVSGLDFVVFRLEYDLPYLDLSAYPPRSRTDSELEGDIRSTLPPVLRSDSFRSSSEVAVASSPDSTTQLPSDSDSTSAASLDFLSHADNSHMRVSMASVDSGFPADGTMGNFPFANARQRSVTPTDAHLFKERSATPTDAASVSSFGSAGDPDRHQRLESIRPGVEEDADGADDSLEVIRVIKKGKNGSGKGKKKKQSSVKKQGSQNGVGGSVPSDTPGSLLSQSMDARRLSETGDKSRASSVSKTNPSTNNGAQEDAVKNFVVSSGRDVSPSSASSPSPDADAEKVNAAADAESSRLPQFDSGVDICGLTGQRLSSGSSPSAERGDNAVAAVTTSSRVGDSAVTRDNPTTSHRSALAEIESKIAEMCNGYPGSSQDKMPGGGGENNVNRTKQATPRHEANGYTRHTGGVMSTDPFAPQFGSDNIDGSTNRASPHLPSQLNAVSSSSSAQHSQQGRDAAHSKTAGSVSSHDGKAGDRQGKKQEVLSDQDDDFDFYSSHSADRETPKDTDKSSKGGNKSEMTTLQESSQLQDYMDYILKGSDSPEAVSSHPVVEKVEEPELYLSLDNNTKLHVMLEIFTQEDEHFIKMFVTRENHTEGEIQPIFVLVSDHCLYLLRYKRENRKFLLHSHAKLTDLIFISTGLNDQTMNIESRESKRQKQRFWLTPGHQALTQAIQACLTEAVKFANEHIVSVRSRFSTGSEVPLQKIALRKYISKELSCEAQDVTVGDYSLVFWEDPASSESQTMDGVSREGTLLLRVQDPFKGYVWKPVYCKLRNGMLCVYNNKGDPRPTWYLGLGGDQCIGCRVTTVADRQHCLELVLSDGPSWLLSAATESEISYWRHSFCLAVSTGMEPQNTVSKSLVPCCLVLACGTLLMCHEDLQTKFFRTLGRAKVEDITAIAMDEKDPTYCVVEFESQESGVTSVQWVFYFASAADLDRHRAALSEAWKEIFMVELPVVSLDNVSLEQLCQNHAQQLRRSLTLS